MASAFGGRLLLRSSNEFMRLKSRTANIDRGLQDHEGDQRSSRSASSLQSALIREEYLAGLSHRVNIMHYGTARVAKFTYPSYRTLEIMLGRIDAIAAFSELSVRE